MNQPTAVSFTHVVKVNGTTDSICQTCLATVATAISEFDLEYDEREHQCDPMRLEHIRNFFTIKQSEASEDLTDISLHLESSQPINDRLSFIRDLANSQFRLHRE
jgi:hypothetical protein